MFLVVVSIIIIVLTMVVILTMISVIVSNIIYDVLSYGFQIMVNIVSNMVLMTV